MPGIGERILYPVAKRWIAGYELEDAIKAAQNANNRKIRAIVNRLGEHTPDVNRIEEYTREYLRIAERLQKENVNGTISVKPSQLGLAAEASLYKRNLVRILEDAEARGLDVWVDMENSPYTERTLQVYRELFEDHRKMGVCLQANLKRTEKDVKSVVSIGGRGRLVKGAYPEKGEIAFKERRTVEDNYLVLLKVLFREGDNFLCGAHERMLIEEAERLGKEHGRTFEFEMLKGIRDDMKAELVAKGHSVGEYIPYGPEWYNYSKRRMRERKRNILLLARSLFG